jgi:hypothetical protein
MSAELTASDPRAHAPAVPHAEARPRFFFLMSVVLLLLVFGGFAQTFFLRPLFDVPAISWALAGHGILMTAWYALLVVQTGLIAAHRTDLHRRLGIGGAVLALAVVVANAFVVLGFPARVAAGQYSIDLEYEAHPEVVHQIVWTDAGSLTAFALYVAIALALRRRPGAHKRMMLFASIAILGPAYGRIANLIMPTVELRGLLAFVVLVGLHLAVAIYDARTLPKRYHPATVAVIVALVVGAFAQIAMIGSDLGRGIVEGLAARQ